jgi:TonB-dependent starch-binding outer membrane protein SusC
MLLIAYRGLRKRTWFRKNFLIMKLTSILLFAACLNATANGFSQTVSISKTNAPLEKVFREIKRQTGYTFVSTKDLLQKARPVTIDVSNASLKDVLDILFRNQPLDYTIVNKVVVLVDKKHPDIKTTEISIAPLVAIQGKIVNEKGEPLSGANVQEKGTVNVVSTKEDGSFTINVKSQRATLVISYVGYDAKEVAVNNQTNISVALTPVNSSMNDLIVIGYGTQKKATLTGSVTSVKGSEIIKSPSTNVSNSIGGRLPGLVTVTPSSEPGYDGSIIRIRGINTLNNNSPLIVVDGVPGRSLDRIDPSTIESISVLKDASAAIYGAQAANGVILITTKRGKTGKPTITATFNQGWGRPTKLPDMADAATYATMINEINQYAGNNPKYTPDEIKKYQDGSDPWAYPNTNWFKEVLRPWSGQNYTNLTINGGNEAMRYFVSLSRRSQEGFYYNSGTKYNQYDFRSNLDGNINKYITLSVDLSGRNEDRNFPVRSAGSIFRMVMRGKPNETAYWPSGEPGPDIEYGDNPVVVSTKATGYDHDKWYILNTNGKINIKVPWVKGLTLTGNAAIDKGFNFHKRWQTPWYLYSWNGVDRSSAGLSKSQKGFSSPALTETANDNQNILLNGLVNYETKIAGAHDVKFLIGAEKITGKGDNFTAYRQNFISSVLDQLFAGAQDQYMTNNGSAYEQARLNYFGRVNYGYKEKYLAEFVWRYQGSYIFPENSRFGFFPGVSLGYKISEEDFWKSSLSFINTMKIRASWGQTGNDQIPEWQYLSIYNLGGITAQPWNPALPFITNGGVNNPSLYEALVPNPNITWERAVQKDIGFDATLLDNKLSITADYFNYKRSDILIQRNASIPYTAGFTPPRENIGKMSNRGFDFQIDYNNRSGKLNYQVGINGGYQKNRIDFWDETPGIPDYQKTTGYPYGSGLYYQAIGIFRDSAAVAGYPHWSGARPGDIIFEDINKDGKIDANDRIRITKTNLPTFTGGVTFSLRYKGFDVSGLIQGAFGGIRFISTESGEIGNFLQSFADKRWTAQNPNAAGPRTFNRGNEYWVGQGNTYWISSTDYVRLKNFEIGYNLPSSILSRAEIQSLRVYVNAYNFLTWSPHMKDFDPELAGGDSGSPTGGGIGISGQNYPLQKIINVGVSLSF